MDAKGAAYEARLAAFERAHNIVDKEVRPKIAAAVKDGKNEATAKLNPKDPYNVPDQVQRYIEMILRKEGYRAQVSSPFFSVGHQVDVKWPKKP